MFLVLVPADSTHCKSIVIHLFFHDLMPSIQPNP